MNPTGGTSGATLAGGLPRRVRIRVRTPVRRPLLVDDLDGKPERRERVDRAIPVRRIAVADAEPDPLRGEGQDGATDDGLYDFGRARQPRVEDGPVPQHRDPGLRSRGHAHDEFPPGP